MCKHVRKAWVVFSGKTDIPLLWTLKKGFRHCFIILEDDSNWITLDPLCSSTEILTIKKEAHTLSLPQWFLSQGHIIIPAKFFENRKVYLPFSLLTCVGTIKNILGINRLLIQTPHQLFKYINHHNKENQNG